MKNITLLFLISFSFAAVGDDGSLQNDEAFVIIGIYSDYVSSIYFKEIDTGESFSVSKEILSKREPKKVKPGNYYLRSFRTIFTDVAPAIFPEPSEENKFFKIDAESVNYLGEWIFEDIRLSSRINWTMDIKYSAVSIRTYAEKNGELKDFPLKLSTGNGTTREFNW